MRLPELKTLDDAINFAAELNRRYNLGLREYSVGDERTPPSELIIGDYIAIFRIKKVFLWAHHLVALGYLDERVVKDIPEIMHLSLTQLKYIDAEDNYGYHICARYDALNPLYVAGLLFYLAVLPYCRLARPTFRPNSAHLIIHNNVYDALVITKDSELISEEEWTDWFSQLKANAIYAAVR